MIQAIDRAAQVLRALQGSRHLGVSELGARLTLPPSTVHGIVKSLQAHGLVAKEPHGQRYMLGPTLLQLSNVYLDTLDVRARAMRWTADLSERTGLAVGALEELLVHAARRRSAEDLLLDALRRVVGGPDGVGDRAAGSQREEHRGGDEGTGDGHGSLLARRGG